MATSSYSSTEETTNACRAYRPLLDPCTDELRDVLRHHVPPSIFPHVIVQKRSNLPRLTAPQINLILPRGNSYTGNYSDMDISLLYILLRNICSIPPRSNGWGNDPDPTDRSLSASIERIRIARNQCVHSSSPALSNVDFNKIWSTVRSAVVELDSFLNNGNQYEKEVDFLRHETMDHVRDLHFIEELRKQAEEDEATRKIVHGLKRKVEEIDSDQIENKNNILKIDDKVSKLKCGVIPLNVKDKTSMMDLEGISNTCGLWIDSEYGCQISFGKCTLQSVYCISQEKSIEMEIRSKIGRYLNKERITGDKRKFYAFNRERKMREASLFFIFRRYNVMLTLILSFSSLHGI